MQASCMIWLIAASRWGRCGGKVAKIAQSASVKSLGNSRAVLAYSRRVVLAQKCHSVVVPQP